MKKLLRVLVIAALLVAIAIPCFATAPSTEAPHTHTWVLDSAKHVPATCTEAEVVAYKCTGCTETRTEKGAAALGHDYGDVTVTEKATCAKDGVGTRKCSRCDDVTTIAIPATGEHVARPVTADDNKEGKAPNCTEDGYKVTEICKVCGKVMATEVIAKTPNANHVPTIKEVESTCTEKGYTQEVCAKCGKELGKKNELPLADHKPEETLREVSPATCDKAQQLGHFCTVCGKVVGKTENGDARLGHLWAAEWTVDEEPACGKAGSQHKNCEREGCTAVKTEEIAALKHKLSWVVDVEPTCTKDGKQHRECELCGKIYNADTVIKAEGHSEKTVVTEATCTEDGSIVTTCEKCGEVLKTVTLTKTGHENSVWKVTKEALACADGEMQLTCTKCGAVLDTKVIKATGEHTPSKEAEVVKAATCTEDGLKATVCTVCGAVLGDEETIPATGHTAGEYTETKAATCTEAGEEVSKCTVCGEVVDTREIAAKGHVAGEWITVRQPSATQTGKMIQKCTVCGAQIGKKYIRANGTDDTAAKTVAYVAGEEVANYAKIDLTVDATTELDLVTANGTKVGKLVVEVKEGKVTVKYELSAVPADAFLTFVAEAPSKDVHAEKEFEFEKAISVADELAGAAAAYIYVEIEY